LAQVMAVSEYPKLLVSSGENGVSIVRVVGAAEPVPAGQEELNQQVAGWQGLSSELQRRAFLQMLRERFDVKVFVENLGGRDNPANNKAKS
jgi:hypothetical protein